MYLKSTLKGAEKHYKLLPTVNRSTCICRPGDATRPARAFGGNVISFGRGCTRRRRLVIQSGTPGVYEIHTFNMLLKYNKISILCFQNNSKYSKRVVTVKSVFV